MSDSEMMTPDVSQIFSRAISSGMRQLAGTRVNAAIEMSESVIQTALQQMPDVPRTLTVRVAPGNEFVVHYGLINATAVLAESMDLNGPRIVIELRSAILAFGMQQMIKTPGISVSGRQVTIDLNRIEALADLRSLWPHLRAVRFRTAAGALFVQVDFAVE